jgi:hypothetical protein
MVVGVYRHRKMNVDVSLRPEDLETGLNQRLVVERRVLVRLDGAVEQYPVA